MRAQPLRARPPLALTAVAALALAACGSDGAQPPDAAPPDATIYTGLSEIEAAHYDYAFDMGGVAAQTTVTLLVVTPGDCLEIGYRPDGAASVTIDGQPARDVTFDNDRLHACDPAAHGWPAGASIELAVSGDVPFETWGPSQVGYSVTNDRAGNPFTYLVSWVGGCDRHGPCDARADRFPTYRFTVSNYPAGTTILCSGSVVDDGTSTTCDFPFDGGPTYSTFSFMAGESWTVSQLGTWDGVAVSLYDYPVTGIAANFDTDTISAHFSFMRDTFGAYPYGDELRFAIGATYWAGFEHPGNISLSEWLSPTSSSYYTNALTHTTMHEITHQWAGDQTTLAGTYDFVWKESMAEYITSLTERDVQGDAVADTTARAWKTFALGSQYFPVPDEQPPLFDYYGDVYGAGPMILFRQLEVIFGRQPIVDALVLLIGTGEAHAIGVADVKNALEVTTGADLTAYFDGWVYGAGAPAWPRVATTWIDAGGGSYGVTIDVSTADGVGRGCQFDVRLTGATPTEIFDIPVDTGLDGLSVSAPSVVTPGFVPTGYQVDPNAKCLTWKAAGAATSPARINPWVIAP
jgi:aminopeptidase N